MNQSSFNRQGFIKLHRKVIEWEWYSDHNATRLFFHLLLTANFEDKKWQGNLIKRGQVIAGRLELAKSTGLTEQQIRTALKKLKSTNEITTTATNKFSIIELVNYDSYQQKENSTNQQNNQQPTEPITNNQPTTNQQLTTTKEIKEIKEDIKKTIAKKSELFKNQFDQFWQKYGKKISKADAEKKFKAALKKSSFDEIMQGLDGYIAARDENHQFWKNPSTWLHQECWNDEYLPRAASPPRYAKSSYSPADACKGAIQLAEQKYQL